MSVKIRLTRTGARNEPSYRIIVIDSRKRRDGKYIERLGYYDPKPKEFQYKVDEERAIYWIERGAIPSATVKSLFKRAGILKKIHNMKYGQKVSENEIEKVNEIKKDENTEKKSVNKTDAGGVE
ncbi:MAG: 30S ribosomal protein S16 [Candidatus Cloacimonetes bacterium]|nr:30S ribosomal protein S16 [Candidatus Cloacimonadota bacterium]